MGTPGRGGELLKEGAANTHLTHLEELVLTQGPEGYRMARNFLLELLEVLKGNSKSHVQTSVKWDGAPAMFAGINPENGKFFVGTKSIFNKVPKINYTEEDIINNHGHAPGLVDKLTKALRYLPQLGITNILQGDFMFDDGMLDVVEIDGEPHYRFKPNTIVYAVPVNSDLGQEIGQSKFGIVFHTTYDSLYSGANFGADVSSLNRVPGIWFDDAFFTDDTGTVTLTENEERRIISLVNKADEVNEQITYEGLPLEFLNIYINSEIRGGQFLEDPESSFNGFISWYSGRLEKRINKLKSERGREGATAKGQQDLESFDSRKEDILNLFRVSRFLFEAKNIFIEKYNNAVYNTKHFVDDGSGDLIATNPEGYVAVDHEGIGVKFVDRLEFSRANFMVDKSAKFTNESTKQLSEIKSNNFTIQISKDRQITKPLEEWMKEIDKINHKYQKPPEFVYKNILNGAPITEIVQREFAQEMIYNTILRYTGKLCLENEDEDADPVADIEVVDEPAGKLYALIPGSMKPPTLGHAGMIEAYSNMVSGMDPNGEVLVFVSMPTARHPKTKELTSARGFPGRPEGITQIEAIEILKKMLPKEILKPTGNVDIVQTSHASPMHSVFDFVSPHNIEGKQAAVGDTVILGASTKGGDQERWDVIINNPKHVRPGVTVESIPVDPVVHQEGYLTLIRSEDARDIMEKLPTVAKEIKKIGGPVPDEAMAEVLSNISASDARHIMGFLGTDKREVTLQLLDAFFGEHTAAILAELGLSGGVGPEEPQAELEEGSTMGSSAVAGGVGKKKKKPSITRRENKQTVDDVIRLLMERGIMS